MNVRVFLYIVSVLLTIVVLPLIVLRLLSKYPHDPLTYTGIGFIVPSFVFLLIAFHQLGSSVAVTPPAKKLVTKGLYGKIRHPIYVFGALLFLGFALVTRGVLPSVILALAIFEGIRRARRENRFLEEKSTTRTGPTATGCGCNEGERFSENRRCSPQYSSLGHRIPFKFAKRFDQGSDTESPH
jgi:protein-S-isoprenylcysteine O-methyltransferase Ste14